MKKFFTCSFNSGYTFLFVVAIVTFICDGLKANIYTVTSTSDHPITGAGVSVNGATGVITGGSGNGLVTVRSAVAAANTIPAGPHTINIPAGTYNLTIAGTGETIFPAQIDKGDLDVTANNVTIDGAGMNSTIINQTSGIDRVFDVNVNFIPDFNFTVDNLTISGGREQTGNGGGGMFTGSSNNLGTVTITNVKFDNNQAFQAMGFLGSGLGGGGLQHQGGDLVLSGCIFNNNSTTKSGGALSAFGYQDLPIIMQVNNTMSVTNCTFTNNTCNGASGGGAIDFFAINLTASTVTVTGCSFSGNISTASGGGAIVNESANVTITESTFLNNQSTAGGAIYAGGGTTNASFCRMIGNIATSGNQVGVAGASVSMNANNNWWGVNTGPGVNDAVAAGGAILILTKWLQLRHTASPTSVVVSPPGSTTLTASFLTNSANEAIAVADLGAIIGLPITFNNAIKGSLSAAQTTIQATGTATATYTVFMTSCPPTGSADATVDNQTTTATITIIDNLPPSPVCNDINGYLISANYTFPPADSAAIIAGTIEHCGLTTTFNPSSLNCLDVGPNIITVTYTDDAGNTASCTATVTLLDTVPPVAICQNVTVNLDIDGMGSTTAEAVDNGSSDICGIQSLILSETSFDCSELGSNLVVLTVTDVNGNSATCSANVQVVDLIAPSITCPDDQVGYADEDCGLALPDFRSLATSDDNCEVDTIVQTPMPGTLISDHGTIQLITFTALDETGNSGQCTFNFTLQDTTPPMAICGDFTVELDDMGMAIISAVDIDAGSSDNCGIFSSELSQTLFTCDDAGQQQVVLTVTDVAGISSSCTAVVTVVDNAPDAFCQDVTVYLDENGAGATTAEDVNNGSSDACGIELLSLNLTSFNCDDVGIVEVILTVTDSSGNTASCTSNVTVLDTIPPTITCPEDQIGYADADCEVELPDYTAAAFFTAADNCGVNTVTQLPAPGTIISGHGTVELVALTAIDESGNFGTCFFNFTVQDTIPPDAICMDITIQLDEQGMATISAGDIDNNSTDNCSIIGMLVSQTEFSCDDFGDNTVTLTVTDIAGNTSTCTANVHVEDPFVVCCDLPVAICQDVTVNLDEDGNASIEVEDVDDGSTADCGLDSIYLDILDFDCDDVGNVTVTLTVIDSNGNMAACTSSVTVVDLIPPTITCPENQVIECGTTELPVPSPTAIGASDNCGIESVTWGGDVSVGTCPEVVTRTYIATDVNGNSTSCTQTFTIVDTTPPSISCPEDDVIDCDEMTCLTFDEFVVNPLGTPVIVSSVTEGDVTVEISAYRKGGIEVTAALFDSDQPITEPDLGTPNVLYGGTGVSEMDPDGYNASNNQSLGNLLIIQNPLAGYPDDHILGDSMVFDFDRSVYVSGLSMIDFEIEQVNSGAGVYMYDQYDVLLGFVGLSSAEAGDNSVQDLYLNTFGVRKLVVYYGSAVPSSGAIGNLCYTYVPFDAVITDLCLLGGAVVDESSEVGECSTIVRHAYWANDDCGNVTTRTCVTTIFGDYQQPDVICPDDMTIDCEDAVPAPDAGQVVATDNCSSGQGIFVTWVEDISEGQACAEVIRRIYSATDECGNVSLCVQFITREELPTPPAQIQLNARVMLAGPMEAGDPEMHPMITELLPLQQPYSGAPFNYAGTESVTEFGEHIVDWVLVELRDIVTMEVISRRAALVTETGDIVDLDGVSPLTFTATSDFYYVAMCHRNHLDVLSDGPVDFMDHTGILDLTLGNAGMIETSPGHWAMIKGDTNKDGLINNTDLVTLSPYAATGHSNEYLNLDVNMDGLVNNTDLVILAPFAAIGFSQGF